MSDFYQMISYLTQCNSTELFVTAVVCEIFWHGKCLFKSITCAINFYKHTIAVCEIIYKSKYAASFISQ